MPLLRVVLSSLELYQRCTACGATNRVQISGLVLGTGTTERVNQDAIALPICPTCGAQETLLRTWDRTPSEYHDSAHCEQRAAVNALAALLKQRGQIAPNAQAQVANELNDPPETMSLDDADPLRLVAGVPGWTEWNDQVVRERTSRVARITFG